MFTRILIVALVSALLTANAGAHEPGGFNGKLYAGEVAIGLSLALIPVGFGFVSWYAATSVCSEYWELKQNQAFKTMSTYPIAIGFGTFLVGELWGAPADNRTVCYIVPTLASFGVTVLSAYIINSAFTYGPEDSVLMGEFVSVIPNAFLTAYVYNVVKKPKEENTDASISVSPYFTASRDSRLRGDFTIKLGIVASY